MALVEALRERGAAVAFVARHAERVHEVARQLPGTHGIVGDVSKKEDIHRIALRVVAALGGLDLLINNASTLGRVPLGLLADTECEELEDALTTNLVGPFRLTKTLLGALDASAREGRLALVINITSDAAVTPYPGWGAYGASKAALSHLTRIWEEEEGSQGVRFEAIDPGDMDTPMHALAVPDADPKTLKPPAQAAEEIVERIADMLQERRADSESRNEASPATT
ncbi:MAG: SDR family NAD(P)-dependent oxidoreductase [Candidatus Rokuibacteriota bacterium]